MFVPLTLYLQWYTKELQQDINNKIIITVSSQTCLLVPEQKCLTKF